MELKYVISHRFMNSTVTSTELNISRLLWTMLSIISFLHSFYVLFSMRYFSLFPKKLSVNNVNKQIWSYSRDSPTHSNQLDFQQCKGITTLQKIGEVAIQNWSGYNTVLQGCNTELPRLRYRIGKVEIQNWEADNTVLVLRGCDKVVETLLYHCWLTCRNWKEWCVWVSVAKQLWQRW